MCKLIINLTDNEKKKLEVMREYLSVGESLSNEEVAKRAISTMYDLLNCLAQDETVAADPEGFYNAIYGGMSFDMEDDAPDSDVCFMKGKKLI